MSQFSQKILQYLKKIDRQELEHIVQELEQNLSTKEKMLNAAQEGILLTNASQKIIFANNMFYRFISKKEIDVIGKPIEEILNWFQLNSKDIIHNLYTDQQTVSLDFLKEDPIQTWTRFRAVPLTEEKEHFVGVCFTFFDISNLKEEDEKRSFTEKLNTLVPLAAGLAHEIGNPLNALDIHMQLALRETRNLPSSKKSKLEKCLTVAKEEINRLDRIVTHFLGAVRPLKGNLQLKDINTVLDVALDFMTPEASREKITIERRFQTNLPEFLFDEDQLKQAFINLIKNAIQAMPDGGLLKVQTEQSNQQIRILFTDTGIGMKQEELSHIFEPYYSTKEKGSGLGLVAVKRIVNNHGGTLQVESNPKKGSTFILRLPLNGTRKPLLTDGKSKQKQTKSKKTKK